MGWVLYTRTLDKCDFGRVVSRTFILCNNKCSLIQYVAYIAWLHIHICVRFIYVLVFVNYSEYRLVQNFKDYYIITAYNLTIAAYNIHHYNSQFKNLLQLSRSCKTGNVRIIPAPLVLHARG